MVHIFIGIILFCGIVIGPKRSLGQGNVFTGVCLSTGEGVGFPACITGHMTGGGRSASGGEGVCIQGEGGLHPEGVGQTPPTGTRKAAGTHPNGMFSCLNMLCLCGSGSTSLF